jgi:cell pole-organizing protein PopZ
LEPLVSPATDASVTAAFNALVASRFLHDSEMFGEIIREMLRPMLRNWLDDNLPIMVERLVRAEIERVARGGR